MINNLDLALLPGVTLIIHTDLYSVHREEGICLHKRVTKDWMRGGGEGGGGVSAGMRVEGLCVFDCMFIHLLQSVLTFIASVHLHFRPEFELCIPDSEHESGPLA